MSQPSSPSSDDTTPLEQAPTPSASLPGEDLSASAILDETPDVDLDRYLAAQERASRRASLIGKFLLGFIPVIALLAYLRMAGYLHRPVPAAAPSAANTVAGDAKGGFSLTHTNAGLTARPVITPTHTKKDPAVAKDLTNYVYKDLKAINPDERQALTAFAGVTGQNFHNAAVTFLTIRQKVVPAYARFLAGAEAIHPSTAPVQAVHRLFVASAKVKMLGFKHMLEGEDDPQGLWQFGVKAEFDGSAQFANQFQAQVSQLAQDQGVKLP